MARGQEFHRQVDPPHEDDVVLAPEPTERLGLPRPAQGVAYEFSKKEDAGEICGRSQREGIARRTLPSIGNHSAPMAARRAARKRAKYAGEQAELILYDSSIALARSEMQTQSER